MIHDEIIKVADKDGNAVVIGLPLSANAAAGLLSTLSMHGYDRVVPVNEDDRLHRADAEAR